MTTEKWNRFRTLQERVNHLVGGDGCMVCGSSSPETISQLVSLLKENKIDPETVAAEMQTLNSNFAFMRGWKSSPDDHGCYIYTDIFLAVCYKFLP